MNDLEQAVFQKKVNHSLKYLNQIGFGKIGVIYRYHEPSLVELIMHWANLNWLRRNLPEDLRDKQHSHVAKEITRTANVVLPQILDPEAPCETRRLQLHIREVLCPALRYISNDIFEIARVTTPVLLSLSAMGTIFLPPQPMAYAIIAIVIARTGVSSVCPANNESM
jgi:hypothetical protein